MRLSLVRSLPFVALAAACSMEPAEPAPGENVARASSAVINGTLDTTHSAVVALILAKGSQGGLCSGTIVKKDVQQHIGWVATAAHCVVDVPPVVAVQAQDFSAEDAIRYSVIDFAADPRYSPQNGLYDFAMVRIAGVDATTPVIPLTTSPDGVSNGTPVTSVGFGRTSLVPPTSPGDENTKRHAVQKTISQANSTLIGYTMTTSGICQGDSGGPVLVGSGANERIVGIHSFVEGDCNGRGFSARVTAGLDFFNQQLAKALPAGSCSLCEKVATSGKNECAAMSASCLADKDCRGYYECAAASVIPKQCAEQYPLGEGPYLAAANCVCSRACTDLCGSSASCKAAPKCGYEMDKGECASCIEGSCCQEETDCAADGQCYVCLKNHDADPACATNATRKKLATCAASKCKAECADSPVQSGSDEPAPAEEGAAPAAAPTNPPSAQSGCATSTGTSNATGLVLALGAVVMAGARRRRRD